MSLTKHIAKQLRAVYYGGNWADVNLKDELSTVSWEQAVTPVASFNTIAVLVYHLDYYLKVVLVRLTEGNLDGNHQLSFGPPEINNADDWNRLMETAFQHMEEFASYIEEMSEEELWTIFSDEKYGTYFQNIEGIIEHAHYHLGQIVFLKKLIATGVKIQSVSL